MTTYIGNAFSPNMVGNNMVKFELISKDEFIKAGKSSISVAGHPEIAEKFNLELNRTSIKLGVGDVLYTVSPATRPNEGKRVEDGDKYHFIPEELGYEYRKITVVN